MSIIPKTLKSAIFLPFLLGATVAALALWLIPVPSVQHLSKAEKDDWQLPVSKEENDIDFLKKLHDQHLWKQEVDESEVDDKDEEIVSKIVAENVAKKDSKVTKISKNGSNIPQGDWQLFGIVNEGKTQYALLRGENEKIERYKKGDLLAKNVELITISNDFVEIKKAEKKETKDLYSKTLEDVRKKESIKKTGQKPKPQKVKRLTAIEKKKKIEEMRRARRAKARAAKARGN